MIYFKYSKEGDAHLYTQSDGGGYFGEVIGAVQDRLNGSREFLNQEGKVIAQFWNCELVGRVYPTH